MINSAQSPEGSRFKPEVKPSSIGSVERFSDEKNNNTPHNPVQVQNKDKILEGINTSASNKVIQKPSVETLPKPKVVVNKFVTEVKSIFSNFVLGLVQLSTPTQKAQELT